MHQKTKHTAYKRGRKLNIHWKKGEKTKHTEKREGETRVENIHKIKRRTEFSSSVQHTYTEYIHIRNIYIHRIYIHRKYTHTYIHTGYARTYKIQ